VGALVEQAKNAASWACWPASRTIPPISIRTSLLVLARSSRVTSEFFVVRTGAADPLSLTNAVNKAVHDVTLNWRLPKFARSKAALTAASRRAATLFGFSNRSHSLHLFWPRRGSYALAYIVQQRNKELGIRLARGASRADLWKMTLSDGLRMGCAGPLVCLLLIPLAGLLIASLGPAQSAMRSNAALALRQD
jgi:hypothetical protein